MRSYFGVEYWTENNKWYCELTNQSFTTCKGVKFYIKDWYENGNH